MLTRDEVYVYVTRIMRHVKRLRGYQQLWDQEDPSQGIYWIRPGPHPAGDVFESQRFWDAAVKSGDASRIQDACGASIILLKKLAKALEINRVAKADEDED
jgi:hypothetical protein